MSHPNFNLRLSKRATIDIEDILLYSLQTWGEQQMYSYQTALREGLDTIQTNPFVGHQHRDLSDKHRVFRVKQHLVIYKIIGQTIFIVRILHRRMDISHHL